MLPGWSDWLDDVALHAHWPVLRCTCDPIRRVAVPSGREDVLEVRCWSAVSARNISFYTGTLTLSLVLVFGQRVLVSWLRCKVVESIHVCLLAISRPEDVLTLCSENWFVWVFESSDGDWFGVYGPWIWMGKWGFWETCTHPFYQWRHWYLRRLWGFPVVLRFEFNLTIHYSLLFLVVSGSASLPVYAGGKIILIHLTDISAEQFHLTGRNSSERTRHESWSVRPFWKQHWTHRAAWRIGMHKTPPFTTHRFLGWWIRPEIARCVFQYISRYLDLPRPWCIICSCWCFHSE